MSLYAFVAVMRDGGVIAGTVEAPRKRAVRRIVRMDTRLRDARRVDVLGRSAVDPSTFR